MSELGDFALEYRRDVIPEIAAEIFPYLMNIMSDNTNQGPGGGQVKSGENIDFVNVPVWYNARFKFDKGESGAKLVSMGEYDVLYPMYAPNGNFIPNNQAYRLNVLAHNNVPLLIMRIKAIKIVDGVYYSAVCVLEQST